MVGASLQVILMDHVDWMDEAYAKSLAATLAQQVVPGGKIIWRSAALTPPYASIIAAAGFKVAETRPSSRKVDAATPRCHRSCCCKPAELSMQIVSRQACHSPSCGMLH
jgi:Protein of unknown function (DUF3419)